MTNRKTTRPAATDTLPLEPTEIHAILRYGVLDVARRSPDLVEDLVQDAWVALLRKLDRLAAIDAPALPAYIRRIATSTAIDRLRHRDALKRGGATTTVPADTVFSLKSDTPDPESAAIQRQTLRQTVHQAASPRGLSRAILELLYLQGLAPAAAAARLGISPHTVYSTVHRARNRLARQAGGG